MSGLLIDLTFEYVKNLETLSVAFVDSSDWGMWCVLSDYRKLRKPCSFGNEAQDKSFHVENGPLVQKATIGEVLKRNLLNVS